MPLRIRMPALALLGGIKAFFIRSTFTPLSLSPALWLDAADSSTITQASGLVSQWNDKSGNGRNATQTTPSIRPLYNTVPINGLSTLSFDGAENGSIMTTTFNLPNNFSLFLVARKTLQTTFGGLSQVRPAIGTPSTPNNLSVFGTFASDASAFPPTSADFGLGTNRITPVAASWVDNQIRIMSSTYNGTTLSGWLDGTTFSTPLSITISNFSEVQIGGINDNARRRFAGQIAEVLIFNSVLSTVNREIVEGYLAWKWGLQANLPVGHPYKIIDPNGWNRTSAWIKIAGVWKQATPFINVGGTWR